MNELVNGLLLIIHWNHSSAVVLFVNVLQFLNVYSVLQDLLTSASSVKLTDYLYTKT